MATNNKNALVLRTVPVDPIASGSSRINIGKNERWASMGGGALLATIGLRRGGIGGALLAAIGGALAFRGATGHCPVNEAIGRDTADGKTETRVMEINQTVTVDQSRADVYQHWRQLENLPRFMHHLERVEQLDAKRSHWVARLDVKNQTVQSMSKIEWDAEITEEDTNNRLMWRSVPGATVDNSGEVQFIDAPNGGTTIIVTIKYRAPEGLVGEALASLFNPVFKKMIKDDIKRFKHYLETNTGPMNPVQERINPSLDEPAPSWQTPVH